MSTSFDLPRPSAHELPREDARSLLVLSVAAAFCVLLFLVLGAIGPDAAGASEPPPAAEIGTAVVCDMGDGIVTTTEAGQTIAPAFCEVRDPALTEAIETTPIDTAPIGTEPIGAVALSAQGNDTGPTASISATGLSFGWRPGFGAVFVGAVLAVRLLGRLIRRRRTLDW